MSENLNHLTANFENTAEKAFQDGNVDFLEILQLNQDANLLNLERERVGAEQLDLVPWLEEVSENSGVTFNAYGNDTPKQSVILQSSGFRRAELNQIINSDEFETLNDQSSSLTYLESDNSNGVISYSSNQEQFLSDTKVLGDILDK